MKKIIRFFFFITVSVTVSVKGEDKIVSNDIKVRAPLSLVDILPLGRLSHSSLGLNAFANERVFGSIRSQYREAVNVLKIPRLRILFSWNDQIQPNGEAAPFWGFYDEIISSLPRGSRAVIVVTGLPSWARNKGDNSYKQSLFLNDWFYKVLSRYNRISSIEGFQLWNEPNDKNNPDNAALGFLDNPEQFVKFTNTGRLIQKNLNVKSKLISAAPTSIIQNFPQTALYFKLLLDNGLQEQVDVISLHFYGESIERLIASNIITDQIFRITKPLWITESGIKGAKNQEKYARRLWPYLFSIFPSLKRIYIYQFTDSLPPEQSFGIRSGSDGKTYSGLYHYLRNQKARRQRSEFEWME